MYHPYFRGKQFELITIREMAPLLAKSNFVPIIEPVREAVFVSPSETPPVRRSPALSALRHACLPSSPPNTVRDRSLGGRTRPIYSFLLI